MKAQARADTAAGPRRTIPAPVPHQPPDPYPAAEPEPRTAAAGVAAGPAARPTDLVTWAQFAEEMKRTPHPVDRRKLQRLFREAGGRVWVVPGQRGERVSRSDALELHRDLVLAREQAVVA
ncbi:hypothetical protein [Kitasatospora cineracea]|uniref:Uncharacterized protein n=1 Tax=Kitasatospora cineracea TaxID=88074 RepID=A0A3N4R7L2_9ACTN|nr:hypothetical protein [Kitasatospora cineracea]RPE27218.1 hypothetical protein EDD38_7362 [Kitasatospora cineracea]RPE27349.1 hypothetical protein EDD38_7494 [Kitasatospora cineracea]